MKKERITIRLDKDMLRVVEDFIKRWEKLGEKVTRTGVIEALIMVGKSEYDRQLRAEEEEAQEPEIRRNERDSRMKKILFDKEQEYRWGAGF